MAQPKSIDKNYHIAIYGKTKFHRTFCDKCESWTLVRKDTKLMYNHVMPSFWIYANKTMCCDEVVSEEPQYVKNMLEKPDECHRIQVSRKILTKLSKQQNHECFYCELKLNRWIVWRSAKIRLKCTVDHLIPYSYQQDNSEQNLVVACHICNCIKSDKMFETIEDARRFVWDRREELNK